MLVSHRVQCGAEPIISQTSMNRCSAYKVLSWLHSLVTKNVLIRVSPPVIGQADKAWRRHTWIIFFENVIEVHKGKHLVGFCCFFFFSFVSRNSNYEAHWWGGKSVKLRLYWNLNVGLFLFAVTL